MSVFLDKKYVNFISPLLNKFVCEKTSPFLAKMRCPYCGDSKKNKLKSRGYLFESKNTLLFKCHNCGISKGFSSFLYDNFNNYYYEYKKEMLQNEQGDYPVYENFFKEKSNIKIKDTSPLDYLEKVSELKDDHEAVLYLKNRKIEKKHFSKIYYSKNYYKWVNSIIPEKFSSSAIEKESPRIIFPFINRSGILIGCQARSIDPSEKIRYVSIMFSEQSKVYGLDTVDLNKKVYVLEGPIDSLFIENSIAMGGSDLEVEKIIGNRNFVIVYDNEPRNTEIVKKIEKCIEKNYNVCIWPDNLNFKDVNEGILQGYSKEYIKKVIDDNTFSDLTAKLMFSKWKKI